MADILVALDNVVVRYGEQRALEIPALTVESGRVLAILGPNGAGKSTLLRVMGLLQQPDQGTVSLFGITAQTNNSLTLRRRIATIFHEPLLLNESVYDNAALGLRLRGIAGREIERRLTPWLERLGIAHLAKRAARSLSGGEAQRASLARAFVLEPGLLLLDEPFSALDAVTRELLLRDFQSIVRATRTTAVMVSHDRQEGFALGDQIGVLKAGRMLQLGSRDEVFFRPAAESVAAIVGLENRIHGNVQACDGEFSAIALNGFELYARGRFSAGTKVVVCIRPDEIFLSQPHCHGHERNHWTGKITEIAAAIDGYRISLAWGTHPLIALIKRQEFLLAGLSTGDEVGFGFATAVHVIAAEKKRPEDG